jgi:hypothetical protein
MHLLLLLPAMCYCWFSSSSSSSSIYSIPWICCHNSEVSGSSNMLPQVHQRPCYGCCTRSRIMHS